MLATIAILGALIHPNEGVAQSHPAYNFRQQVEADNSSYGGDPVPILTMDCLAANGVGQWTLSSQANGTAYPAGWYLLENGLYKPSLNFDGSTHPECIPPGVVQNDVLSVTTAPTEPKATANLDQAVNYLWPNRTSKTFDVRYFASTDIDISLSSDLATSAAARKVVKNSIQTISIPTWTTTSTNTHNVVTETDYRDAFDVVSDGAFLYIVWASTEHPSAGTKDIWVTAVPLGSNTPATGFPLYVGQGERPTIACDPRNNRGGGTTAAFDIAYLTSASGGGTILSVSYNGTTPTMHSLQPLVINPSGGADMALMNPTHIRALVSSVYGTSTVTHAVYAIIQLNGVIDPYGLPHLVVYNPIVSVGLNKADYVDGSFMTSPTPIPAPALGTVPSVVDEPIIAFANPYDNQSGTYDEFHCLYELKVRINNSPIVNRFGLVIVRGWQNCPSCTHSSTATADTRYCLSQKGGQLLDDPTSPYYAGDIVSRGYVGAVNQMGIHVHWRTGSIGSGSHFYARDMSRTFDEDIDENTLVTDSCIVADGSSTGANHGGTVGATILQGHRMTVWTDPNYGFATSDENSGLYQPRDISLKNPYVGQLTFVGDDVRLYVGGASEYVTATPGKLAVMPYFYFNFDPYATGQGVTVHGIWDYYGLVASHSSGTQITTPFRENRTSGTFNMHSIDIENWIYQPSMGDPVLNPSYLNVHGGADFYTDEWCELNVIPDGSTTSGFVDVLYEENIYPRASGANDAATGHMTLLGQTTITGGSLAGGNVRGHIPSAGSEIIMTVDAGFTTEEVSAATYQFLATDGIFSNNVTTGTSELRFGHVDRGESPPSFWNTTFDGGSANAIKIHAIDPDRFCTVLIENMSFDDIPVVTTPAFDGNCILIEDDAPDPTTCSYGPITVHGNNFGTLSSLSSGSTSETIYLRGFDGQVNPPSDDGHSYATVTVSSNTFTSASNSCCGNGAGITLENTTANVLANVITDPSYGNGIFVKAKEASGTTPFTTSLICSNRISGTSDASVGIRSDHNKGYVKLDTLSHVWRGYWAEEVDKPHIIFNQISDFSNAGLHVEGTAEADLSGVHGSVDPATDPSSPDYGAYNTIAGTGPWDTHFDGDIALGTSTCLVDLGNYRQGSWTWSDYADNNITAADPSQYIYDVLLFGSGQDINGIDENWWGTDIQPGTVSSFLCTYVCDWDLVSHYGEVSAYNVAYTANASNKSTGVNSPGWSVSCGDGTGYSTRKKRSANAQSLDSAVSGCQLQFNEGHVYSDEFKFQQCYDTLKRFIETCPSWKDSWRAFSDMDAAVQGLQKDTSIWRHYRDWLESVLYLNRVDPEYFCACVESISNSFVSASDTTKEQGWKASNESLAVIHWLLDHTACDTSMLRKAYTDAREFQYQSWLSDTTKILDTTLPSMHDLGLDSLLNLHLGVGLSKSPYAGILSSFTISKNPFTATTTLHFDLDRMVYMRVEVYDELGRIVTGDGSGYSYEPGNHQIPIDLKGFASGAYYLRISLGDGEVRTIKMVKKN